MTVWVWLWFPILLCCCIGFCAASYFAYNFYRNRLKPSSQKYQKSNDGYGEQHPMYGEQAYVQDQSPPYADYQDQPQSMEDAGPMPVFEPPPPETPGATFATEDTPPGATKMNVGSNAGFNVGNTVEIDAGTPSMEVRTISDLGSLIFSAPLQYPHPKGCPVQIVIPEETPMHEGNIFDQPSLMPALTPLNGMPMVYPTQQNYTTTYPAAQSMSMAAPQYTAAPYTQAYTQAPMMAPTTYGPSQPSYASATVQPTYGAYGAYGGTAGSAYGTSSMRIG